MWMKSGMDTDICLLTDWWIYRQPDTYENKYTDVEAKKQRDIQTLRHLQRKTYIHTDSQTKKQTDWQELMISYITKKLTYLDYQFHRISMFYFQMMSLKLVLRVCAVEHLLQLHYLSDVILYLFNSHQYNLQGRDQDGVRDGRDHLKSKTNKMKQIKKGMGWKGVSMCLYVWVYVYVCCVCVCDCMCVWLYVCVCVCVSVCVEGKIVIQGKM